MNNKNIILFDLDGVIIDGINEYWKSSLMVCQKYLLSNMNKLDKKKELEFLKIFMEIRPWVKYGWEMVLITHEIIKSNNPLNNHNKDNFLKNYAINCSQILKENSWDAKILQQYLDEVRKFQIKNDFKEWISLHCPYIDVANFIRKSKSKGYKIGVISTKGKSFTSEILNYFDLYPELVFGYESGSKVEIISNLTQIFEIHGFIEDRKQTLINILNNDQTKFIKCYLAEWGYLKKTDKNNLPEKIRLLKIKKLEEILAN